MGCASYRALAEFPKVDLERIGCMGNSGGGTITYAACMGNTSRLPCHPALSVLKIRLVQWIIVKINT